MHNPPVACSALVVSVAMVLGTAACSTGGSSASTYSASPIPIGATTTVNLGATSQISAASAVASDPSVLTVGRPVLANDDESLSLTGLKEGAVTVSILDPAGDEVDRLEFQVVPVQSITTTMSSGATILTGQSYSFEASALGLGGLALPGTGALSFSYDGALASTSGSSPSNDGSFEATSAGSGDVVVSAASATTTVALHAVAPSSVDAITLSAPTATLTLTDDLSVVSYELLVGTTVVYGAGLQCVSADTSVASVVVDGGGGGPAIGGTSTGFIAIGAQGTGSTTVTCSMNGLMKTVAVTVQ